MMLTSLTLHFNLSLALAFPHRMYSLNLQWDGLTFALGGNLMASIVVLLQCEHGEQIWPECSLVALLIIRDSFALYLLRHEMKVASQLGKADDLCRSTITMQSSVRTIIYVLRQGSSGIPMDLDMLAFWSHHMIYVCAAMHIKFGIRDESWESDLDAMIDYLRYFSPRYKLYST
jgi:hypothetical protein